MTADLSMFAGVAILTFLCRMAAAAPPEPRGPLVLRPFGYHGVTLDDGLMRRQFDEVRDYYLRVPNDDLLKGFRRRAGHSSPGQELGGWYSNDWGNNFGQILSALARMAAATGDPACRAKLEALIHEWGRCVAPDGYPFYSDKPGPRLYMYEKMVCGLVDACVYAGNREAPGLLRRITDWADAHLARRKEYANANPNMSRPDGDVSEWYTLPENLYRAYLATGDARYRRFADEWLYTEFWDLFTRRADLFGVRAGGQRTGGYHAYSHVNSLSSAAMAYVVTGERRYLDAARNAFDYLQAAQCMATGGYGPNETLAPSEELRASLETTHNTFETPCGSWAAFKLAKYLITLTGEARYGDWVERLVYNGIGATLPSGPRGGVMYYADYNLNGGSKRLTGDGWECCSGTRPQVVADYYDQVYYRDAAGLYVSLFTPSSAAWTQDGAAVTVRQRTAFPASDRVEFVVSVPRPTRFTLALRAPAWLAGPMTARVNGRARQAAPDARRWVRVRREWRDGDRLEVTLPMKLWVSRFGKEPDAPAALLYGPVVLAARPSGVYPLRHVALDRLAETLTPAPGEPLCFHARADANLLFRPYFAFREGEPYYLSLDPHRINRVPHTAVTFQGAWNTDGLTSRWTPNPGATAEYAFEGTAICWHYFRVGDGGMAEVSIDGAALARVDQYAPGVTRPATWTQHGLTPGKHVIRIRALEEKNPASPNRCVNVAGFEVPEGSQ